ncbi:MAG: UDP-glucose 4-epimerase GalE [Micropruina sp.]|uniref:UDP-glucose 4-epimerase GalE n=1 Tax=Micropruina sp. TaxID=2737536 RepID=UPI0039E60D99
MRVLVTGGAGYIGSHTTLELLANGHHVVVVDYLSNSSAESLRRVAGLAERPVELVEANVGEAAALDAVFARFAPEAVIHFAGRKAVGESTRLPLLYYRENVAATITLLETMAVHDCRRIVFSSSATVYGSASEAPFAEDAPTAATNPYGRTKQMVEQILADAAAADPALSVAVLRYFNPIGAHESGLLGEDPKGVPNNLLSFVAQVAAGRRTGLQVFGNDYPTPDGTGLRDYVHVVDLAQGHLSALDRLGEGGGYRVWNLGSGRPASVLQVIEAYARAAGTRIPYRLVAARPGDVAASYADVTKAERELGWTAHRSLDQACADTARWQAGSPDGYAAG